jgi:hypothetical protein
MKPKQQLLPIPLQKETRMSLVQDLLCDVTDRRVVRRLEKHPQAWRLWQPFLIQGEKKKQLILAFGAMVDGKKDMGDILASLSKDDSQSWEAPVAIFDHNRRQGAIHFTKFNLKP